MSLGLVSPLLNRGVRSRWVATLPASSKMLTIDAAGDVSYTDIPTAAWGSITGTLSNQTDLQNALNAKLSLSGGTVTGQLTNALGTITASTPLTLTQTWNNAAVTFTGALVNVTDTASNASSLLMDLQVGGSSVFSVDKNAFVKASHFRDSFGIGIRSAAGWLQFFGFNTIGSNSPTMAMSTSGTNIVGRLNVGASTYYDSFGSNHLVVSGTTILGGAVEQRSSTSAQTFRIYNTFTDASNYERAKIAWESNVLRIGTEKAGTGSARAVEIQTDGTTRLTVGTSGNVTASGYFQAGTNGFWVQSGATDLSYFDVAGLRLQSTQIVAFATSTHPATKNVGISRSADGVLEVNNGTIGTLRDLKLRAIELADGNLVLGTTTGTKIGTATTQKIGFYNATPVVQPAAVADATDAASVITQLNLLLSRMRDLGLIAT